MLCILCIEVHPVKGLVLYVRALPLQTPAPATQNTETLAP